MVLINFPLLIVPFAVYNFFLVATDINPWETIIFRTETMAGGSFSLTTGEGLVVVSLFLLLGEMTKAARNPQPFFERLLSAVVFLAFAAEFVWVARASTSTFFLMGVIALVAWMGSYLVSPRHAVSAIVFDPEG